jgi:hypothetical protein
LPPVQQSPVRFGAPRSVVCGRSTRPIGFSRPRGEHTFPCLHFQPACPTAVPLPFEGQIHASTSTRPLRSASTNRPPRPPPLAPCGPSVRIRAPSWGLPLPSSRRQPAASTDARNPNPVLRSVLGVSHALDGLLRHRPCRFVSPCSHVQGSPEGVLHVLEQYRVTPAGALVPFGSARLRLPAPAHRPWASGPCSPRRVQHATGIGKEIRRPAPFELVLLRVFSARTVAALSRHLRS